MKLLSILFLACLLGFAGLANAQTDTLGVSQLLTNPELNTQDLDTLVSKCQSLYFKEPGLAMELSLHGLDRARQIKDSVRIAKLLNIQAAIFRLIGRYEQSMELSFQVNQIYLANGDSLRSALSQVNILAIFWDYYDDIDVTEYAGNPLQQVLENVRLVERLAPHTTISGYYYNLAGLYQNEGNFSKARHFGRKALLEARLSGNEAYIAEAWGMLGLVAGSELKRDSIESYVLDSSEYYCEKAGHVVAKIANQNNMADFYYTINELDVAERYWLTALRLCEQSPQFEDWLNEIYMNLAKLYQAKGDYDKAFYYQSKYLELEKKKYQVQSNNLIAVNEAERRKLAMQAELAQSDATKKRAALENARLKNQIASGILLFIVILFSALGIAYYPRIKNYKYLKLKNAVNDHYVSSVKQGNRQIAKELDEVRNMITNRMEKRDSKAPGLVAIVGKFERVVDYTKAYTFIAYSTRDRQTTIEPIKKRLDEEGFRTKIDVDHFEPGKGLQEEVNKHVEGASHVLVMVSENSLASSWVATEVFRLSSSTKKKVIVCDLDGAIHQTDIENALKKMVMGKLATIEDEIQQNIAKGESLGLLSNERDRWAEYMVQLPSNIVNLKKNLMINLTQENYINGLNKLVEALGDSRAPKRKLK